MLIISILISWFLVSNQRNIEEYYLVPFFHIRPGFFMQNLSGVHANEIIENNEIFVPAGKSKTS